MSADPVLSARGRCAYWTRFGDPAKVAEARQDLSAVMLERTIRGALGVLRPEQRDALALILIRGSDAS